MVESLSVPSGGGGIGCEVCVFVFKRPHVLVDEASSGCAEVAAVGADEPEPAGAVGQDVERSGVVGDVVAFTQGQQIVQIGGPPWIQWMRWCACRFLLFGQPGWAQWPCWRASSARYWGLSAFLCKGLTC